MNLFQLEYFVVLAETLNYTRASEKLHITQPNLSKVIINIERSIGCQLFIRSKRDVQLTHAGEVFYQEIKKTMDTYENAIKKTQEMESGASGILSIGFLGTAMIRRLPQIMNAFYVKYPKIKVELKDYTYSPLVTALAENEIDIAILPDQELNMIPNIARKHLFSDDMCVAVHHSHRFAERPFVTVDDLIEEPFVNMNPKVSIRDYNLVNGICMEHNFLPNTVYEANTLLNLLMMVECKVGITILAQHMVHFSTENVRFVKLKGYERFFKMICAWRKDNNPSIPKLLEVIDEKLSLSE